MLNLIIVMITIFLIKRAYSSDKQASLIIIVDTSYNNNNIYSEAANSKQFLNATPACINTLLM